MRIFVTGASGYIGSAVAAEMARGGHQVFGLARSDGRAREMECSEVSPVIGSIEDSATWADAARAAQVLVHCAAEFSPKMRELDTQAIDALVAAAKGSRQPRLIVYTSGCWVYGNTGGEAVDEAGPLRPFPMVAWRVQHEERILNGSAGQLRTIVVRPGCVYGGRGGLTGTWFQTAAEGGAARIVGDGRARWTMVHVADLARLYRLLAESPWSGEIFNASDHSRFTVGECAEAASRAAGAGGRIAAVPVEEAAKEMGPVAEALAADQHIDASKAVRMLGWQPRHGGFVDGVTRYYRAWKASAEVH